MLQYYSLQLTIPCLRLKNARFTDRYIAHKRSGFPWRISGNSVAAINHRRPIWIFRMRVHRGELVCSGDIMPKEGMVSSLSEVCWHFSIIVSEVHLT